MGDNTERRIAGVPVVTNDGRVMCYACYQDNTAAGLLYWMPDDPDNYPCACEVCGVVLTGPARADA